MRKKICIFLLVLCGPLFGEDFNIKNILKDFTKKYGQIKNLSVELTIETINLDDQKTKIFCKYYYEYPDKFYKKLKADTSENITISNGKKIRVSFPESGISDDFNINELDTDTLNKVYLQNLLVNYIDFNKMVKMFEIINFNDSGPEIKLNLKPKQDYGVSSIRLNLKKDDLLPRNLFIKYIDMSGENQSEITFNEIKINSVLDTNIFVIK